HSFEQTSERLRKEPREAENGMTYDENHFRNLVGISADPRGWDESALLIKALAEEIPLPEIPETPRGDFDIPTPPLAGSIWPTLVRSNRSLLGKDHCAHQAPFPLPTQGGAGLLDRNRSGGHIGFCVPGLAGASSRRLGRGLW